MKRRTDFDGVWTYPEAEGLAHGKALDAALMARVDAPDRAAVSEWIAAARRAVRADPERWGWLAAGRLAAFADEDPFTEHAALLHYLHDHRGGDAIATRP